MTMPRQVRLIAAIAAAGLFACGGGETTEPALAPKPAAAAPKTGSTLPPAAAAALSVGQGQPAAARPGETSQIPMPPKRPAK